MILYLCAVPVLANAYHSIVHPTLYKPHSPSWVHIQSKGQVQLVKTCMFRLHRCERILVRALGLVCNPWRLWITLRRSWLKRAHRLGIHLIIYGIREKSCDLHTSSTCSTHWCISRDEEKDALYNPHRSSQPMLWCRPRLLKSGTVSRPPLLLYKCANTIFYTYAVA